jgi:NADH-quinone oxidoreductase subunit J
MTPHLLLFYLFATVAVAAAVMVIAARNPVHSVLFLILTFFNAAALFVLVGAEFLAMVLVVVYVGAVAVLFMFVVMMLNVNYVKMRQGVMHYLPIGGLVGLILLVELVLVAGTWTLAPGTAPTTAAPLQPRPTTGGLTNTEALGNLLYTEYFYLFQAAGVILLVAIIGAITLTLRERGDVRRQDIGEQVHRDRATAVELRKVKPRAGI